MINPARSIELLDRKYVFTSELADRYFLLGVDEFIKHINRDEIAKSYKERFIQRISETNYDLLKMRRDIVCDVKDVRRILVSNYPELDDSNIDKPNTQEEAINYTYTLANFDRILNIAESEDPNYAETGNSENQITTLLSIINTKISALPRDEFFNGIFLRTQYIAARNAHLMYMVSNYAEISPEMALFH